MAVEVDHVIKVPVRIAEQNTDATGKTIAAPRVERMLFRLIGHDRMEITVPVTTDGVLLVDPADVQAALDKIEWQPVERDDKAQKVNPNGLPTSRGTRFGHPQRGDA